MYEKYYIQFQKLGTLLKISVNISEIDPIGAQVEEAMTATISCVVKGISQTLNNVVWKDSNGAQVTGSDYVVDTGTYNNTINSQTTTLTVNGSLNTADTTFSCVIDSTEWAVTGNETSVSLEVFCK